MIIDFHTHIFPDKIAKNTIDMIGKKADIFPFFNGTAEGLLRSMEEGKIDYSVILPVVTSPRQFTTVNAFAAEINQKYGNRKGAKLISLGGIHPDSPDYKEELKVIKELGLKGIKLHPDYQGVFVDDIRYMRIMDYASELGLFISIHAGVDVGYKEQIRCTVQGAKKVINEVKPKNLILAHYGGYALWDEVYEELAGEEVYLDTAFVFNTITKEQFLKIFKKHGSNKILFATDGPWSGQKESLQTFLGMGLTKEEEERVLSGNARYLLDL